MGILIFNIIIRMKYTYAIAALLASANAINDFGPSEQLDLQVGVDAAARSNVRQTLKNQLRAALSHDGIKFQNQKFGDDGYPGFIIPGSEPLLPIASAPIDMNNLQLDSEMGDAEMTVAEARAQAAQMQVQMDASVAEADAKRADQQSQYEKNIQNDDPQGQLQGLMNAQASLHRLSSGFSAKPKLDKVTDMAKQLGIPMTPDLMQLGSNEAISNALVEIAVGMGKTEEEIGAALG